MNSSVVRIVRQPCEGEIVSEVLALKNRMTDQKQSSVLNTGHFRKRITPTGLFNRRPPPPEHLRAAFIETLSRDFMEQMLCEVCAELDSEIEAFADAIYLQEIESLS